MKTAAVARILLGLAVLALIGATALAEDNSKSTITINGGRQTVFMKSNPHVVVKQAPCKKGKFYDNICGGDIDSGEGWTISDGSPIDTEYTPAGLIVSLASGTTTKVAVEVGFVTGTNGAEVYLDKDCKGLPCGTIYKTALCKGKISNLFTFGDTPVPEPVKCKAKLKKGTSYWVYNAAEDNSWLAWDLSSATGGLVEGTNGVWGTPSSGEPVGGLAIY